MDNLKRIFQCVNPSTDGERHSHDVSDSVKEVPPPSNLFLSHYKQQHLASMAENQAVFELQKKYIEKRIHYINTQSDKIGKISREVQQKIDIFKKDAEWIKFE